MAQTEPSKPPIRERPTLTDRLRVISFKFIDPIVTVLAKLGVSPNSLTILGMLFHVLFAWLIAHGQMLAAAVTMTFLVPLDALDGSLARKKGITQGGFGAYLDSTLDRVAEIILFAGFLFYYFRQDQMWMMSVAYVAIGGSLMVSYSRAKAESLGFSAKIGVLSRVERYVLLIGSLYASALIYAPVVDWALMIMAALTWFTFGQRMWFVQKQAKVIAESES